MPAVFHARSPGPGIGLAGPCGPELAPQVGFVPSALLVLSGVTSGSGEELSGNTRLALAGLELGAALGTPLVLLCSSAAVYRPGSSAAPFSETGPAEPERPYGRSKLEMELAAAAWTEAHPEGPRVLCLRLSNIAGADMLGEAVRRAAPEAPLRLDRFAAGTGPRRSYLSPVTFARAVAAAAAAPPEGRFGIVNLAEPGGETGMGDLLEALCTLGHPVPWQWQDAPGGAVPSLALDLARMRALWPGLATTGATAEALAADWLLAGGGRP
nr:NAD(P)-dependent oxidoreductase [Mangrovicoccus sp. HB161399]